MKVLAAETSREVGPGYLSSVYGTTMWSDVDLHMVSAPQGAEPDLTLVRAAAPYDRAWKPDDADLVSHWWDEKYQHGYLTARTPDGFRLRIHDRCDFDLSADLTHAQWTTAPGVDPGWVPVFAAGTFMTLVLMLRGHLVLHASAVTVGERGLAFVGRSGQGKSTLATLMCADGARLVSDDVGRVSFDRDRVLLARGGPESRLRPSASRLAERLAAAGSAMRATGDGRHGVSLAATTADMTALDAVVVPAPRPAGGAMALHPVGPARAVAMLSMFPRLNGLLDTELIEREFSRLADLVDRVSVHVAQIPWQNPPDDAVCSWLTHGLGWS